MKDWTLSNAQIWVILVGLTAVSVATGEGRMLGGFSTVVIVAFAVTKARLVVLDYMEARHAPPLWRWLYEGWLAAIALLLLVTGILA